MSLALLATDSLCDPQIMYGYLRITAERRTAFTGVIVVARYRALYRLARGCVYQRPLRSRSTEAHIIQDFVHWKVSNWIKFDADTRGHKNHVHDFVKKTTDQ